MKEEFQQRKAKVSMDSRDETATFFGAVLSFLVKKKKKG